VEKLGQTRIQKPETRRQRYRTGTEVKSQDSKRSEAEGGWRGPDEIRSQIPEVRMQKFGVGVGGLGELGGWPIFD